MSEIVVKKFGTNLLADQQEIDAYAAGLKETYLEAGAGLVVVTSGAIAVGRQRADAIYEPGAVALTEQQLAAVGSVGRFMSWEAAFEKQGILVASVAVTHRQLASRSLWKNLFNREEKRVFNKLMHDNFASGIPVVLNESDAISIAELFKDNDGMGAHVSIALGADEYQIFTKSGGLRDDDGEPIEEVNRHNLSEVRKMVADRPKSEAGRGGFLPKIDADWEAARAGVGRVSIAAPNDDMTGERVTRFVVE